MGAVGAAAHAVRTEGFFGLYRGVLSPLTGIPLQYFMSFGSRAVATRILPWDPKSTETAFAAGALSGLFSAVVTTPVELVKARLQIQIVKGGGGARDTAQMLRNTMSGGIRSLFTGMSMTLWRDIPGSAIYYGAYHVAKNALGGDKIGVAGTLLAGGLGGVSAWICLFPVDLVKSRVQTHEHGNGFGPAPKAMDVIRDVIRKHGVRGLYHGLTASLIRAFPADAAAFLGYEYAMKGLHKSFSD
eukprot:TRINITY_DN161_c0_g1_i1.p2 TRINITY_DN161_c0_g1~~TRINITY_DN161_c0_g1_i1.p2  ORF type:complete len:275 (+),score=58.61 TRINITY_DN161_c0_g1_i1:97-825(+)